MIRRLEPAELPRLECGAREFYQASAFLGDFDIATFCKVWDQLLSGSTAAIFADVAETGRVNGALGGIIHRELYGARLIADEFFWFMRPDSRETLAGVRLYFAFEQWARAQGAAEIQMCHLLDSMPEKVARFYLRQGYKPIEMRFAKAL